LGEAKEVLVKVSILKSTENLKLWCSERKHIAP